MLALVFVFLQVGCATVSTVPVCPANTQNLPDCPPLSAKQDAVIDKIYKNRTWISAKELGEDPIAYGMNVDIPIQGARGKILGPTDEGAIDSLAVKLWMLEHAEPSESTITRTSTPLLTASHIAPNMA